MKKVFTIIILFSSIHVFSQITKPTVLKADNPQCEIMQIGITDSLTFVFFKYTNISSDQTKLCVDENSCIKIKGVNQSCKLISCINVPISPSYHLFDSIGQVHYFSIVYQAVPQNTNEIDIIVDINSDLNFYGVSLKDTNTLKDSTDYINLLEQTPVKEKGYFYKEGKVVQYYIHKGLVLTMHLTDENLYGHYYAAYISIENYTDKRIDFFPENIYSIFYKGKIETKNNALSYNDYSSKVKRKQEISTFFVALGETIAANSAGYSSSTTKSNTSGEIDTDAFHTGSFGDSYGSFTSNVRTYANFSSSSSTSNYSASAQYYARQNAANNIQNHANRQYRINNIINQGYLKTNTLFPNQRINGYVNISYERVDQLKVVTPIKKEKYIFAWPFNDENLKNQNYDPESDKSEDEKLMDKVFKENAFTESSYSSIGEVKIGDIVKFITFYGDVVYGVVIEIKGKNVIFRTYPSVGNPMYWNERFSRLKQIKY